MPDQPNGWNEWSKHVILQLEKHDAKLDRATSDITEIKVLMGQMKATLDRLDRGHDAMANDIAQLTLDLNTLKTKAATWGGVVGAIGGGLVTLTVKLLS